MEKILSYNVNLTDLNSQGAKEIVFKEVNGFLDDGYFIKDKIVTVPNGPNLYSFNVIFILAKRATV